MSVLSAVSVTVSVTRVSGAFDIVGDIPILFRQFKNIYFSRYPIAGLVNFFCYVNSASKGGKLRRGHHY